MALPRASTINIRTRQQSSIDSERYLQLKAIELTAGLILQVGGTEAALFDYARGGPQWGADALIIGPPQVSTLLALHVHAIDCHLML